jgi:hypothetical protein
MGAKSRPHFSMTRNREDSEREFWRIGDPDARRQIWGVPCVDCGGKVLEGDWPWCKGDPAGHVR